MTDYSVTAFDIGLKDLSPKELKTGCEEILRFSTFFPAPAEVREALENYRKREVGRWGSAEKYPEVAERTPEEKAEDDRIWQKAWENIKRIGKGTPTTREPGE